MEKGSWVEFRPISSLTNNGPIDFHVAATEDEYIDIGRTRLYLKVTIRKNNNQLIDDNDEIAPINLILHSLFSQVDVKLNGTLVTPSLTTYPYRAYLETLLSYGQLSKKEQLKMQGWWGDTSREYQRVSIL